MPTASTTPAKPANRSPTPGSTGANPALADAGHGFGDGKYNMGNPVSEDVNALLIRAGRWFWTAPAPTASGSTR